MLTLRAFAAGTVLLVALPAWCGEEAVGVSRPRWWIPEAAVLSTGFYGLRGPQKWDDGFTGLEVRASPFWWELRFMLGALGASDGNMHVYLGVLADLPAGHIVHLILSFAPALSASGTDHYLGYPLIFRSTVEVSFAITEGSRLGLSFSHLSNGKLAAPNPGVETLSLTLTVFAVPY